MAQSFIAFLVASMKLMQPVKKLGRFPALVQPGLAAGERAFELLDQPPEVLERADAHGINGFTKSVRFEEVGFAYSAGETPCCRAERRAARGEVIAVWGRAAPARPRSRSAPALLRPDVGAFTNRWC